MTSAPEVRRQVAQDAFLDPYALVRAHLEGDRTAATAVVRANEKNAAGLIHGLTSLCAGLISELADSVGSTPVEVVTFMQALSNDVVDSGLFEQLRPQGNEG